jgi:hypothetical protein
LPEAGAIRYIGVHIAAIHGDVNAARALVRQTIAYISGLEGTCPVRNPNNVLKVSKIDDFGKGPLFYSDLGSAQVGFEKYMADDTVVSIGLLFIPDADRGTTRMGDARIGDMQRATYRIDVDIEKASELEEALMPPAISATEEIEIEDLLTKLHRQSLWHRKPHARAPFRVQCASGVHGT